MWSILVVSVKEEIWIFSKKKDDWLKQLKSETAKKKFLVKSFFTILPS